MIHPQMATMLAYVMTDVEATPEQLSRILGGVASRTFNRISIDGDTSTNDTLMLMASGKSALSRRAAAADEESRSRGTDSCASLSEQMVRDGEGVKHHSQLEGPRRAQRRKRRSRLRALLRPPR